MDDVVVGYEVAPRTDGKAGSNWLAAALEDVSVDAAKMAAMHFIWIFFSVSGQWELVGDKFAEAGSGYVSGIEMLFMV